MATVELDPQFIKALRLLRSKSKDSGAQLRAMLDEAIRQKKGLGPGPRSPGIGGKHGRDLSLDRDKLEKDKKKDLDRLKKDLSELTERPTEAKRSRLDSPALSSSSHTPSPTPSRGEIDMSDGASEGGDFGDIEMNLEDQFDCSCCVCKTFTQESGNKLMECSSCQNLYHQECHNPPVSNEKASDPRLIWNCDKCSNKGKNVSKSSGSMKDEKRSEKEKSKSSSSSNSRSSSHSGSSKHKPSPAKHSDSRGSSGPPVLSISGSSSSSKLKTGSSGVSSSSAAAGQGPAELSSNAKKRMKLIKQQAADMASISKKKASK